MYLCILNGFTDGRMYEKDSVLTLKSKVRVSLQLMNDLNSRRRFLPILYTNIIQNNTRGRTGRMSLGIKK